MGKLLLLALLLLLAGSCAARSRRYLDQPVCSGSHPEYLGGCVLYVTVIHVTVIAYGATAPE